MWIGLTPANYLTMLKEEYSEYQRETLSRRKAINCCTFANALPEIIFAHYGNSESAKVHNIKCPRAYRDYLRSQSEAHHTVRDLCDFSKHLKLDRKSVNAQQIERTARKEGHFVGLLALTQSKSVERLVVTFQNVATEIMDNILKDVLASWETIFQRDRL